MADDVSVRFGAQIDGLVAGINDAKASLQSLTAPINGIAEAFQGLGEVAVAGLAVDKVYEYQKQLADLGEGIERTSNLTGLSTDQVQQFQFAVKMTGGDAETAATSLVLLERNIAEAQSGSGRAYQAFMNLGVSLDDLKTKSPNEILQLMAQRFSETGDTAQQAAIKIDYMRTVAGRAGTNLIPLLNQGPEGLQKLNEVLDSTNSKLSPGMVDALAEAKRTSIEADAAWRGFLQTISTTGFFDAVNHDLIDLAHYATVVANAVKSANKAFNDFISDQGDRIPTEAEKFRAAAEKLKAAMAGMGGQVYGPPAPAPAAGNPLPALPTGTGAGADDADKTQGQIERSDYQTSLEIDRLRLQSRKDTDQAMVDSGQMSATQQIADLQEMAGQEYAMEMQAVDQLASTYDQDSAEYAELKNKKLVLAQQFANEQAKLTEQLAATQKKAYEEELAPWKSLMGDMGGAFDKMIDGVLMGTQSLKQTFDRSLGDLLVKFTEVMAKMTAEFFAFEATSGKGILGFGTTNPFAALGGAGAGAAGSTAGAAAQTAATTANTAAITAGTLATTTNTTAAAATGAQGLAATAENTVATLGNTIAVDALKAIELIKSFLPSFDVGSYSVPSDMIARIHQGEMIVPAAQAAQIRAGSASLGSSSVSSGGTPMNLTFQINAIDTQTGAQFLKNNAAVIAQTMATQMRNGNNSLTSAMRT